MPKDLNLILQNFSKVILEIVTQFLANYTQNKYCASDHFECYKKKQ